MNQSEIVLIAHNIRSLWNVGSLFRTADAFAVSKIVLSGFTPLPPRREIAKTALGADEWIAWEHSSDVEATLNEFKSGGYMLAALEITDDAVQVSSYDCPEKICLILGHEVTGVSPELLGLCDDSVFIPMQGKKESLNVAVATGVALSHLRS